MNITHADAQELRQHFNGYPEMIKYQNMMPPQLFQEDNEILDKFVRHRSWAKPRVCTQCDLYFESASIFDIHDMVVHSNDIMLERCCRLCSMQYSEVRWLNRHYRFSHFKYQCNFPVHPKKKKKNNTRDDEDNYNHNNVCSNHSNGYSNRNNADALAEPNLSGVVEEDQDVATGLGVVVNGDADTNAHASDNKPKPWRASWKKTLANRIRRQPVMTLNQKRRDRARSKLICGVRCRSLPHLLQHRNIFHEDKVFKCAKYMVMKSTDVYSICYEPSNAKLREMARRRRLLLASGDVGDYLVNDGVNVDRALRQKRKAAKAKKNAKANAKKTATKKKKKKPGTTTAPKSKRKRKTRKQNASAKTKQAKKKTKKKPTAANTNKNKNKQKQKIRTRTRKRKRRKANADNDADDSDHGPIVGIQTMTERFALGGNVDENDDAHNSDNNNNNKHNNHKKNGASSANMANVMPLFMDSGSDGDVIVPSMSTHSTDADAGRNANTMATTNTERPRPTVLDGNGNDNDAMHSDDSTNYIFYDNRFGKPQSRRGHIATEDANDNDESAVLFRQPRKRPRLH